LSLGELEPRLTPAAIALPETAAEEFSPGAVILRSRHEAPAADTAETGPQLVEHLNGGGLQFNLLPAPGMPAVAIAGFRAAADLWSSILRDDVRVNLEIDYRPLPAGILGMAGSAALGFGYSQVKTALANDAKSPADQSAVATLPATSLALYTTKHDTGAPVLDNDNSGNNTTVVVNSANARALGLLAAGSSVVDGGITFSSRFAWDFHRSNGIAAASVDFVGVAVHEIGHVLGFTSGADTVDYYSRPRGPAPQSLNGFGVATPLDLFRHSPASEAAGAHIDLRADRASKYFSVDGGATPLTTFSTGVYNGDGRQASHWKDHRGIGVMDPTGSDGEYADITNVDVRAFDVIGWDVAMDAGDAPDAAAGTGPGNYATAVSDNGPRHLLFKASGRLSDPAGRPKVFLGAGVTADLAAQPNGTATGDADDGVTNVPVLGRATTRTVAVTSTGRGAKLDYFFDFNRDGDFADAGEAFAATLTDAVQAVSVTVPPDAAAGPTVARFRVSTAGGLTAVGPAADGEVEDYQVTVTGDNARPVLDPAADALLVPVSVGDTAPAGMRVGDFALAGVTDADVGAVGGIAVTGTAGAAGQWSYSLDDGAAWQVFTASQASAAKLRAADRVRFVPAAAGPAAATLTFHAWDQTVGVPGGTANLTNPAADTSVSLAADAATVRVGVGFAVVDEDVKSAGHSLAQLAATNIHDDDPAAKKGFAVLSAGGTPAGRWEYFVRGWKPMPALKPGQALLLRGTDKVRFVPAADQTGDAALAYRAWDQTTGAAGAVVAVGAVGGGTAFSAGTDGLVVRFTPVNDRPVIDTRAVTALPLIGLTANGADAGSTVAAILGATVTDIDRGSPLPGLAVTSVSKVSGHWEYSTGGSFLAVPVVSAAEPLLLGPADRLRFVPAGRAVTATLAYRAWDRSPDSGAAGSVFTVGSSTAFSQMAGTATLAVTATPAAETNVAPVLNTAPAPALSTVTEDTKPAGNKVAALLGTAVSDADGDAKGIAVTGLTGTAAGVWQFSSNGRSWAAVPAVSPGRALLLKDTDFLRYVPNLNSTAGATVSYVAWDRTRGTAGQLANVALPGMAGGTGPFSLATETATVAVAPANDAPALTTAPGVRLTTTPVGAATAGDLVSKLLGSALTDVDAVAPEGIAVTAAVNGPKGRWEFQLAEGGGWATVAATAARPLYLRDVDRVRFLPLGTFAGTMTLRYRGWDQSVGAAGQIGTTVRNKSLSAAAESAVVSVGNANTRPVLDTKLDVRLPAVLPEPLGPVSPGSDAALLLAGLADPDAGALSGVAVTAADNTNGQWQFQIDGGIWKDLLNPTAAAAFVLKSTDKLRFVPADGYLGAATVSFKAWDQSVVRTAGEQYSTTGDAFSKEIETATLTVNTAPTLTI